MCYLSLNFWLLKLSIILAPKQMIQVKTLDISDGHEEMIQFPGL